MKKEQLLAPKYRRLAAALMDYLLIFLFWYLMTQGDLARVNTLMETLDPQAQGALDLFSQAVFQLVTAFLLKWIFCQTLLFTLLPAMLGKGKTLGKLIMRISLLQRKGLEEMSPSRLMLRELIGRSLLETCLILPGIISLILVIFSRDGLSLRDRLAKTVVIRDTSYID
ncbi:MAG: RDD family protein [Clostridia bacterium]|nr:RDD family protein [Clostridia bacterium]